MCIQRRSNSSVRFGRLVTAIVFALFTGLSVEPRVGIADGDTPVRILEAAPGDFILRVQSSPDGRLVAASGGFSGAIYLWETANWSRLTELPRQKDIVRSLRFSEDGLTLIAVDGLGRVTVNDVLKAKEISSFQGSRRRTKNFFAQSAISVDGRLVAIEGFPVSGWRENRTVSIYETRTGKQIRQILVPNTSTVPFICFDPTGKRILIGGYSNPVLAYDVQSGLVAWKLDSIFAVSHAVDVSTTQNEFAAYNGGRLIRRINASDGSLLGDFDYGEFTGVDAVAIEREGRFVASTDSKGRLTLWNRRSGLVSARLHTSSSTSGGLVFVPGHSLLLAASGRSQILVFDVSKYAQRE